MLMLAERRPRTADQRLKRVVERGAFVRRNEKPDRHAGAKAEVLSAKVPDQAKLMTWSGNLARETALPGLLIDKTVDR